MRKESGGAQYREDWDICAGCLKMTAQLCCHFQTARTEVHILE